MTQNKVLFDTIKSQTDPMFQAIRQANQALEKQLQADLALVDQWKPAADELPAWADQVYAALPDWGREACSHRWLDGLYALLEQIAFEQSWPVSAGQCGDVPPAVAGSAERLAAAAEDWLQGLPSSNPEGEWVAQTLGQPNPDQQAAVTAFIELVRAAFNDSTEQRQGLAAAWRQKAAGNPVLERVFFEGGLDEKLDSICGFQLIDTLKAYLALIGGEPTLLPDLRGWCNVQLRQTWMRDPERILTTQGILWGLYSAWRGLDPGELRPRLPWCAGAAGRTRQILEPPPSHPGVRQWLLAAMLVKTRYWYLRMLNFAASGSVSLPEGVWQVPDLTA